MKFDKFKDLNGNQYDFNIIDKKIKLNNIEKKEVSLYEDTFISPGWIDGHVHCVPTNPFVYSHPDEVGYKSGVTMVIDAGSTGIDNLNELYELQSKYKTNIKALLNISKIGIPAQMELNDLNNVNINIPQQYKDIVVGYKARISGSVVGDNGVKPLEIFNELRKENDMPVMVHVGNTPPEFCDIVSNLKDKDVITHMFHGKNESIFKTDGSFSQNYINAIDKGVKFDVGHGNDSMNFSHMKNVFEKNKNFKPSLITTDIYEKNMNNGRVKSLGNVMDKMHNVGMEWNEVVDCVTKNISEIFNLGEYGLMKDDNIANFTIFKIVKGNWVESDSKNLEINLTERIIPLAVILNGEYIELEYENGYL